MDYEEAAIKRNFVKFYAKNSEIIYSILMQIYMYYVPIKMDCEEKAIKRNAVKALRQKKRKEDNFALLSEIKAHKNVERKLNPPPPGFTVPRTHVANRSIRGIAFPRGPTDGGDRHGITLANLRVRANGGPCTCTHARIRTCIHAECSATQLPFPSFHPSPRLSPSRSDRRIRDGTCTHERARAHVRTHVPAVSAEMAGGGEGAGAERTAGGAPESAGVDVPPPPPFRASRSASREPRVFASSVSTRGRPAGGHQRGDHPREKRRHVGPVIPRRRDRSRRALHAAGNPGVTTRDAGSA